MNFLTILIYIDRYLGGLIIKISEILVFIKQKINKNYKADINNITFENIVIIKFLGIGSISRSLGLLENLNKKFPKAKITFITFSENKNFIKLVQIIDNYKFLEKRNFLYFLFTLIKLLIFNQLLNKKTLYIDLECHSNFSKIISFLNYSNFKIGFYIKNKSNIFNHSIFFDRLSFIESNYNKISAYLKVENSNHKSKLDLLKLKDKDISIEKKLKNVNLSKDDKFFVININASDLCIERKWDILNFENLIRRLLDNKYKIILIGSKEEHKNTRLIKEKFINFKDQIFNFAGLTSIGELISLFKDYKIVFVTNDSGPLHLANISKCATISLWGPGNPVHYAENYRNHKILYKKVHCSPCIYVNLNPPCKGNNICMKEINVEEVFKESIILINKI